MGISDAGTDKSHRFEVAEKRFQYLGKGMKNHKIEIPIKKRTAEQCGAFFVELK